MYKRKIQSLYKNWKYWKIQENLWKTKMLTPNLQKNSKLLNLAFKSYSEKKYYSAYRLLTHLVVFVHLNVEWQLLSSRLLNSRRLHYQALTKSGLFFASLKVYLTELPAIQCIQYRNQKRKLKSNTRLIKYDLNVRFVKKFHTAFIDIVKCTLNFWMSSSTV